MAANASVLVDKATSDLLIGPDWGMNLEICDVINADPGQARDVVKAVKKRLSNKSPRVQLLALTLIETLMKNCGDSVHQNVVEKEVLLEMVKVVKRKSDMAVRDKILVLLDSWQEAFGGISSRYPQYYMAYDDLRRMGVEFPERTAETAVLMFTPPPMLPSYQHPGLGSYPSPYQNPSYGLHPPSHQHTSYGSQQPTIYGSPPARLDAVMAATDGPPLWGTKDMDAARSGMEVLNEMLNAIDAGDKQALKDDVIIQLVEQCRSYQKNILHLVNNTSDETLLFQGLALNDELQRTLAKHDAVASGSPSPHEPKMLGSPKTFSAYDQVDEDVEDEFSQLAHRQSLRSGQGQGVSSATSKERWPAAQFALPPPPQSIRRMNSRLDAQGRPIDLLSGQSVNDMSSPTTPGTRPTTSPRSQQAMAPLSEQLNPFADSPSFVATPQPQATRQPPIPPIMSGAASPPHHQQYPQSQFLQQLDPVGYVVPWAVSGSPAQQQEGEVSGAQQQNMSNPSGASQIKPSASNWNSYGATNTVQTNQINPWSAPMSLEQRTMSLSLHDSSNKQSTPIGKLAQSPSPSGPSGIPPPTKAPSEEANPADKWFEDLVDLSGMSANFKKAGLTSSLSRPNTSKAGGM